MISKLFFLALFAILIFTAGNTYAEGSYPDIEWVSSNVKTKERLLKMRGILAKQQTCVIAIDGMFSKFYTLALREEYLPKTVHCVGDIVTNQGTLREESGCALVTYNLNRATYGPFFNDYFRQAISNKGCSNGGFEDLMQKKGWWSGDAYQNSTVEQTLFTPVSYQEPWKFILVYSQSEKYSQWFSDARKRGEDFVSQKREPELKRKAKALEKRRKKKTL